MRWEHNKDESWNKGHHWGYLGGLEWDWNPSNRNRLRIEFAHISENLSPGDPRATIHHKIDDDSGTIVTTDREDARWSFIPHNDRAHVAITFGNGNSDPVLALYFDIWVPTSIGRKLPA